MTNTELENILTRKGVKPTSNRLLVIRELVRASRPVSLTDLETALDTLDKTSIFRVLELFTEKDIVHTFEDGTRALKYELCQSHDEHTIEDEHVHFYCEQCKEVYCFESVNIPLINIPQGFQPHSINYMIKGLCPHCSGK